MEPLRPSSRLTKNRGGKPSSRLAPSVVVWLAAWHDRWPARPCRFHRRRVTGLQRLLLHERLAGRTMKRIRGPRWRSGVARKGLGHAQQAQHWSRPARETSRWVRSGGCVHGRESPRLWPLRVRRCNQWIDGPAGCLDAPRVWRDGGRSNQEVAQTQWFFDSDPRGGSSCNGCPIFDSRGGSSCNGYPIFEPRGYLNAMVPRSGGPRVRAGATAARSCDSGGCEQAQNFLPVKHDGRVEPRAGHPYGAPRATSAGRRARAEERGPKSADLRVRAYGFGPKSAGPSP